MKPPSITRSSFIGAGLVLIAGCSVQLGGSDQPTAPASTAVPSSSTTASPTANPTGSPTSSDTADNEISQWPELAVASSRYGGDPSGQWGEDTLLGPPQVTECADDPRAWASQEKNSVESVAVGYEIPVVPTKIRIVENFNPGNISRIELLAPSGKPGETDVVYKVTDADVTVVVPGCPQIIEVTVPPQSRTVDAVLVEVDQRDVGDWAEIDAIQLIGYQP